MEKAWMIKRNNIDIKELASQANVSEMVALLLSNRAINDKKNIERFLRASIDDMHDPLLMKDMDKGTDIIIDAVKKNRKIVIYGDYDADGVTSTVILYRTLLKLNANVIYYIPDRETEGYGICYERIDKLKDEGCEVILTCDNGIAAVREIEHAKGIGMIVVVTDHHEISNTIPLADAIINPKQNDCNYPFKLLCGAGIAYKFSRVIYEKMNMGVDNTNEYLELAGIGTICDIVDLLDENRIIAKQALKMLTASNNIGINALKNVLGIDNKKISIYNVGFQLGPCINATGRLYTADLAAELLMCDDNEKATEIAGKLNELNKKRQEMTNNSVNEIVNMLENDMGKKNKVIVAYNENLHESIAGIVAGRIKDKYNLPTIILTKGKDGAKGSARSIEEYNLFEELLKCKELLEKFGGHPMAAGLSLKKENITLLREKLNNNCELSDKDIIPKIRIDKRLNFNEINEKLINDIEILEPFGKGNSSPLFAEKNVIVESFRIIGKDSNTIKLLCKTKQSNINMEILCFNKINELKEILNLSKTNNRSIILDIIFCPYINEYNGYKNIQLKLIDFRMAL